MVLKVDLNCCKCYKKVKKVLCKFPGECLSLSPSINKVNRHGSQFLDIEMEKDTQFLSFMSVEIRDQAYDEKQNTVTIKVVSCCPEKLRQKIWCKGGKSIKSIEIKPPKKEKDEEKVSEKKNDKEKIGLPRPADTDCVCYRRRYFGSGIR